MTRQTRSETQKKAFEEAERLKKKLHNLSLAETKERSESDSSEGETDNTGTDCTRMAPIFEDENGADATDVFSKLSHIKVAYMANDLPYWFRMLEQKMRFAQVKAQYTKLQVLTDQLPSQVLEELKPILSAQDEESATCYKEVKTRILELFGPKEQEDYAKATQLLLSSTPSQLARRIIALICEHKVKPLETCCCKKTVAGIWLSKLPEEVQTALATETLGGGNLEATLMKADAVYYTLKKQKPQVAVISEKGGTLSSHTGETNGADQVAAMSTRGRGRGSGNSRGRGRGNKTLGASNTATTTSSNPKGKHQGIPRHSDAPPETVCRQHWRYGKSAHYCTDRATCPWKDLLAPRPVQ